MTTPHKMPSGVREECVRLKRELLIGHGIGCVPAPSLIRHGLTAAAERIEQAILE